MEETHLKMETHQGLSEKEEKDSVARSMSMKERILLKKDFRRYDNDAAENDHRSIYSDTVLNQSQSSETSDIRNRIRINKEKLEDLLNHNPLSISCEAEDEESDLPFHSGPLRLSIFRESSPPSPKKAIEVTDRYDAVFESFVKRRPLSENFTTNFSTYDFSSSSDEEVSEPLPESPLNLSDTESMSSGHNSPGLFSRRRHKFFSSSQSNPADNRPKSLYDSAKPQPPHNGKQNAEKGKVGDRLSRMMQFRSWRSSNNKKQDYFESSYERSYEPVPPNVTWTNVVGQNSVPKFQPHPPTTSPTNTFPNPKKKRHAPKPPTNITPYNAAGNCKTNPSEPHENLKMEHFPVDNNRKHDPSVALPQILNDGHQNLNSSEPVRQKTESPCDSDSKVALTVEASSPLPNVEIKPSADDSTTPKNDLQPERSDNSSIGHIDQKTEATSTFLANSDATQTTTANSPMQNGHFDGNSVTSSSAGANVDGQNEAKTKCIDPVHALERQRQVIEELVVKSTVSPEAEAAPVEPLRHVSHENTGLHKSHPSQVVSPTRNATTPPPVASLHGTDLVIRLIVEDLVASVEEKLLTEARKSGHFHSPVDAIPQSKVVPSNDSDVTNDFIKPTPQNLSKNAESFQAKSSKLSKSRDHRKSMDNASSGYSSPGSSDETPISPEMPVSPLTIPSPTSSYYSTSLSASSSRVSNLSRELTLAKSPTMEETASGEKSNSMEKIFERPLADPTNEYTTANERTSEIPMQNDKVSAEKLQKHEIMTDGIPEKTAEKPSVCEREGSVQDMDGLTDIAVKIRGKSMPRLRAKSEYIPYRSGREELENFSSRVSISMIEKPTDTASLSRAQAKLYHQKGSKKKALAAAQKSRAFAMRAKPRWTAAQRHSYAESEDYILDETQSEQIVPSSNLVSHFVSTQDISTYFDGSEYRTITAKEILNSKREEFFNAFKHAPIGGNSEIIGGSVRHLPVSTKEFGFINDIIQEDTELDSASQVEKLSSEKPSSNQEHVANHNDHEPGSNKENAVRRNPSEASSSSSDTRSSVFNDSTWSVSGDMSSQGRQRKPSLKQRIKSAISFQNIRKAISMEKLNEDEKRRSMSHHYLNENGTQYAGARERSSTLQDRSSNGDGMEEHQLRKAPSISSLISSVRMRKRRSRMRADHTNRYTIADPECYARNLEATKKSSRRPVSVSLTNSNRKKLEDVGKPSFFRPIGRVLQMNPSEGTIVVEMIKPTSGRFDFYIARKKECGDSGSVYISRLSDSYPDKMFAGLMRTGDEITEVNGKNISDLSLDDVYDLILNSNKTVLKLKPSQVHMV